MNEDKDDKLIKIVCRGFLLLGSLIVLAGAVGLVRTVGFVLHASQVPGIIVDSGAVKETSLGSSQPSEGWTYSPIFTFTDRLGIVHTQRMSWSSSTPAFIPGEKVSVLYDPATPERSKLDTFREVWLGQLFLTGFGLLVGGLSWLVLFTVARQRSKEKDYVKPITDPDFGSLQFVLDCDDPALSSWEGEWTFPKTGTVISISLPGGKEGPRPEARQFYLGLPGRFAELLTTIHPLLQDVFKRHMRQELPQDIFTVVRLTGFYLEIPKGQPLRWNISFETTGPECWRITIPFIGDTPEEAEVEQDDGEMSLIPAKDLRQEFRLRVDECRRRSLIYYPCVIVGTLVGIVALALNTDVVANLEAWIIGLFLLGPLYLIPLALFAPKLRCPACLGNTKGSPDLYCPECGGSPVIQNQCGSCGKQLLRGANGNFRMHYCTHCRAYLVERGE